MMMNIQRILLTIALAGVVGWAYHELLQLPGRIRQHGAGRHDE